MRSEIACHKRGRPPDVIAFIAQLPLGCYPMFPDQKCQVRDVIDCLGWTAIFDDIVHFWDWIWSWMSSLPRLISRPPVGDVETVLHTPLPCLPEFCLTV